MHNFISINILLIFYHVLLLESNVSLDVDEYLHHLSLCIYSVNHNIDNVIIRILDFSQFVYPIFLFTEIYGPCNYAQNFIKPLKN